MKLLRSLLNQEEEVTFTGVLQGRIGEEFMNDRHFVKVGITFAFAVDTSQATSNLLHLSLISTAGFVANSKPHICRQWWFGYGYWMAIRCPSENKFQFHYFANSQQVTKIVLSTSDWSEKLSPFAKFFQNYSISLEFPRMVYFFFFNIYISLSWFSLTELLSKDDDMKSYTLSWALDYLEYHDTHETVSKNISDILAWVMWSWDTSVITLSNQWLSSKEVSCSSKT